MLQGPKTSVIEAKRPSDAPSHYLNQYGNIAYWTLRNKFQWNFNWNSNIFIEENTFENVACEMLSISSRPQCVYIPGLEKVYLKHSISSAVKAPVLAPIVRPQNMLSRTLRSPLQKNHSGNHGTAKKNMYLKNRNHIIKSCVMLNLFLET